MLLGYARCSTDVQDFTAEHDGLTALGEDHTDRYPSSTGRGTSSARMDGSTMRDIADVVVGFPIGACA
jgi:hypothetical protein